MKTATLATVLLLAATLVSVPVHAQPGRARNAAEVSAKSLRCNIRITSYRFVGAPGTSVKWGSRSYAVPGSGTIELIPNRKVTRYETPEGTFTLPTEGPVDQFGILTIDLASNQIVPLHKLTTSQLAPMVLGAFSDTLAP